MKEKAAALTLALLLAMGLSACDGDRKKVTNDNDILGDERPGTQQSTNNGTTNNGTANNGTVNNGSTNNTKKSTKSGGNTKSTTGGMNKGTNDYNTTNPALAPQQTATWRQMLQNGRVHDTDGFLLDGENTHWA